MKRKSEKNLAIGLMVVAALVVIVPCGVGVLAAIAIPAFLTYTQRAKTQEARANLRAIATAVEAVYGMESFGPDGPSHVGLPPSVTRTPAQPYASRQVWPEDADPGWLALSFSPAEPVYYAYEYERDPDSSGFAVRALGDLDGDGTLSTFEIRGHVRNNQVQLDPMSTIDELE